MLTLIDIINIYTLHVSIEIIDKAVADSPVAQVLIF